FKKFHDEDFSPIDDKCFGRFIEIDNDHIFTLIENNYCKIISYTTRGIAEVL
ncbi:hypothetical protein EAI_13101, partial [Harpegnathos saltator]